MREAISKKENEVRLKSKRHIVKSIEFKNRLNDEKVWKLSAVAGKLFHGLMAL
jgi:hypothetical protein